MSPFGPSRHFAALRNLDAIGAISDSRQPNALKIYGFTAYHYFGRFLAARDSQISFSMIHGWSAFGGPTMVGTTSNWEDELRGWLKPFLDRLGHKSRRRMCPLYVAGLIGPGDRKSVQPMAEATSCIILLRLASGTRRHWRQSCSFKRIGSLVAATPCW